MRQGAWRWLASVFAAPATALALAGPASEARVHNIKPTDSGLDPDSVPDDLVDLGVSNTGATEKTVKSYAICRS